MNWKSWHSGSTRTRRAAGLSGLPDPGAKRGAMGRRTLGIGVINFAYTWRSTVNATPTAAPTT